MTAETDINKAGARALCDMKCGGFHPLGGSPRETAEELIEQVVCLLQALSSAYELAADGSPNAEGFATLVPSIKARALEGVSSLASVALFLMREG